MNIIVHKAIYSYIKLYNFCKIPKFKIHFELKLSISELFEQEK